MKAFSLNFKHESAGAAPAFLSPIQARLQLSLPVLRAYDRLKLFFTKRDRRCQTETVLLLREGISGAFDFALRIAAPFIFSRLKSALPCLTRCCLVLRDYELFWHFFENTLSAAALRFTSSSFSPPCQNILVQTL